MEAVSAYSRDGEAWTRIRPGRPVITRGEPGCFDSLMVECPSPFVTVGDEHRIYYAAASCHHDLWDKRFAGWEDVPPASRWGAARTHLGLATIRRDGWVAMEAWIREGYVETKPVYSEGEKMIINAKCNPGGYIAVEIMDNWNNVWKGFGRDDCDVFTGDDVNHVVSWRGRSAVNTIPGCTKLRFRMKNAELYSFRISDG